MSRKNNDKPVIQKTGVRIPKNIPFNFSFGFDTPLFDCTVSIKFRGDRKERRR